MLNRTKLWGFISALLAGGALFQLGCGNLFGGQWRWVWAILQEDIFG